MIWQDASSEYMINQIKNAFPTWIGTPQQVWEGYFRKQSYFLILYDRQHGIPIVWDTQKKCAKTVWVLLQCEDKRYYGLGHYNSLGRRRNTPPKTWANKILNNGRPLRNRNQISEVAARIAAG